jgi:polyisoprenoid-binding protein YceI
MRSKTRPARLVFPLSMVAVTCLTGCPLPTHRTQAPSSPSGVPPVTTAQGRIGRPYDVVSSESLLTILAFRGGALAKAGHNHVIASHDISGTFYVPDEVLRSTFELHLPVAQLTIDEPELRTREGPDFPAEVPESAREGTRRNMLSEALLNGGAYPDITLVSQHLVPGSMGSSVLADVQVTVRGQAHTVSIPVAYSLAGGELAASGELAIKQSDLGLTPYSALLGALQVQDELRVRFRLIARAAATH